MAISRKNFIEGIGLVPNASTLNSSSGDLEYLSSDGKLHIFGASVNDAIVQEALTQTLTNKSISGSTNTLTAIPNAALTNSSLTINGSSVSLGGSTTVTATASNALTFGTGLSGTSYNGSTPVTVAIDSSVVTLTGSQTLTNKTLTSPHLNTALADSIGPLSSILALTGIVQPANFQFSGSVMSDTSGGITLQSNNVANGITLNAIGGSNAIQLQNASTTLLRVNTSSIDLPSATPARFYDSAQTNYVGIKGPASVTSSYNITLPTTAPASGTAFTYNGTNYVWSAPTNAIIPMLTKSISYTLGVADDTVYFTGGSVATLPTAVGVSGKRYTIISNSTSTSIAIATTSGQTVGPYASSNISLYPGAYDYITVQSDGSNWQIIDKKHTDFVGLTSGHATISNTSPAIYQSITGNSIILSVGEWQIYSTISLYGANSTSNSSAIITCQYYSANGTGTTSSPTGTTASTNFLGPIGFQQDIAGDVLTVTGPTITSASFTTNVLVSSSSTIYLVPKVFTNTGASGGDVTVSIWAKRIF